MKILSFSLSLSLKNATAALIHTMSPIQSNHPLPEKESNFASFFRVRDDVAGE